MFYSQETFSIHGWLSLVVPGLQPSSVVQNTVFRQFAHHRPICNNTLMKYFDGLTRKVEEKISAQLPSKFAIAFDGWCAGSTHYVCLYATFVCEKSNDVYKRLLAFRRSKMRSAKVPTLTSNLLNSC